MRGTYVILASVSEPTNIEISSKRQFAFEEGFYAYVGSALSGLERRVARHLSPQKKYHWHIDYLLRCASVCLAVCAETKNKEECFLADALSQRLPSVPGFGCSDCTCSSHLFFSKSFADLKKQTFDVFKQRNLSPFIIS